MSIDLHYLDTGALEQGGSTVPLVIVHGLLGSADNWRSHIRAWQARHRVIAVDLRNHGKSPHVAGMGYDAQATDVIALLDRLDIEQAYLLGHSMGGKVVMSLARMAPQRVAALIVADVAPVRYAHGHDDTFGALRRVVDGRPTNRREADELMAECVDDRSIRLFLATNLVRDPAGEGLRVRVGLDELEADYESIRGEPAGEGAFEGPTLVLRGSRSTYVTDAMLPRLREVLPETQLVTLDAGHWLHADQAEAFRQAVDDFLAQQ